jgi:hypothetical protein
LRRGPCPQFQQRLVIIQPVQGDIVEEFGYTESLPPHHSQLMQAILRRQQTLFMLVGKGICILFAPSSTNPPLLESQDTGGDSVWRKIGSCMEVR